jgi:hypothetical protein
VNRAVTIHLKNNVGSAIQKSEEIRQEGLRNELTKLRPDLMLERRSRSQRSGSKRKTGRGRTGGYQGEVAERAETTRENESKVMEILEFLC